MKNHLLNGMYGLLGLIVISAFAFKIFQPVQVLPRMHLSPAFSFIDQNNERLTSEDLRGQFVLFNFTYTNYPTPCYHMNETIQEIQSRLDEVELGDINVSFVTISFDPDRDIAPVLGAYAQSVNANTEQWSFATEPNKALLKTIIGSGFETYYEDKGDGTFAFDPAFVLVDGWGIVRAEYRYSTEVSLADRILRHLGVLAEEARSGDSP
jgi:protein SCO1/2